MLEQPLPAQDDARWRILFIRYRFVLMKVVILVQSEGAERAL